MYKTQKSKSEHHEQKLPRLTKYALPRQATTFITCTTGTSSGNDFTIHIKLLYTSER